MSTTKELSKKINAIIEKNNDAYKGYKKVADKAESSSLTSFFLQQASERQDFATKLTANLKAYDPDFKVDTDGSATGSMHRAWIDVKAALSIDDDEALLEECLRGDKASADEYEKFLENNSSLHADITNTIRQQLQKVRNTLSKVSSLEDLH